MATDKHRSPPQASALKTSSSSRHVSSSGKKSSSRKNSSKDKDDDDKEEKERKSSSSSRRKSRSSSSDDKDKKKDRDKEKKSSSSSSRRKSKSDDEKPRKSSSSSDRKSLALEKSKLHKSMSDLKTSKHHRKISSKDDLNRSMSHLSNKDKKSSSSRKKSGSKEKDKKSSSRKSSSRKSSSKDKEKSRSRGSDPKKSSSSKYKSKSSLRKSSSRKQVEADEAEAIQRRSPKRVAFDLDDATSASADEDHLSLDSTISGDISSGSSLAVDGSSDDDDDSYSSYEEDMTMQGSCSSYRALPSVVLKAMKAKNNLKHVQEPVTPVNEAVKKNPVLLGGDPSQLPFASPRQASAMAMQQPQRLASPLVTGTSPKVDNSTSSYHQEARQIAREQSGRFFQLMQQQQEVLVNGSDHDNLLLNLLGSATNHLETTAGRQRASMGNDVNAYVAASPRRPPEQPRRRSSNGGTATGESPRRHKSLDMYDKKLNKSMSALPKIRQRSRSIGLGRKGSDDDDGDRGGSSPSRGANHRKSPRHRSSRGDSGDELRKSKSHHERSSKHRDSGDELRKYKSHHERSSKHRDTLKAMNRSFSYSSHEHSSSFSSKHRSSRDAMKKLNRSFSGGEMSGSASSHERSGRGHKRASRRPNGDNKDAFVDKDTLRALNRSFSGNIPRLRRNRSFEGSMSNLGSSSDPRRSSGITNQRGSSRVGKKSPSRSKIKNTEDADFEDVAAAIAAKEEELAALHSLVKQKDGKRDSIW
jgi:hypothetical protein